MRFLLAFLLAPFLTLLAHETTFPYLSEDVWPSFCNWRLSPKKTFDPLLVKRGDTILIEDIECRLWETLERFTKFYLPRIQHPVILVTPRTDYSLPGRFNGLLESDKIIAWFVQNIDRPPSSKLFSVPIGLSSKIWGRDTNHLGHYGSIALASSTALRKTLIYVNFSVASEERERCLNHFRNLGGAHIERNQKSFEDYVRNLANSVFVISPPGNGEDCHRTWEALLMGCYPVVKTSPLDAMFQDLPVIIIKNWEEVTEEFLRSKLDELSRQQWPREKLYAPYWFQKVSDLQAKARSCSG